MSPKVQSPKSKGLGPRSVVKSQLGYALDASARNGARLWSKTQPQRLADAKDVGTTPRAAAGAPHTAALRSANLRQVHSPNGRCSIGRLRGAACCDRKPVARRRRRFFVAAQPGALL